MRRTAIRFSFVVLAASAIMAVFANAQAPDFSKVQIKTNKISNNFYTLDGQGGTIGVLAGPDGVFMVDGQFAPLTDKIVAAIKQITNAPIKYMVNTHVHGDHTGGNENFGKLGVTILARGSLRNRLMHPAPAANGNTPPATLPVGLPVITYNASSQLALHMDGEDVQLIPIPNAHTDGDTLVRFVQNDVIMTGDFFRSVQYPNIDRANGGGLNGMINGLGQIIARSGPNTKIIPGHGPQKRDPNLRPSSPPSNHTTGVGLGKIIALKEEWLARRAGKRVSENVAEIEAGDASSSLLGCRRSFASRSEPFRCCSLAPRS